MNFEPVLLLVVGVLLAAVDVADRHSPPTLRGFAMLAALVLFGEGMRRVPTLREEIGGSQAVRPEQVPLRVGADGELVVEVSSTPPPPAAPAPWGWWNKSNPKNSQRAGVAFVAFAGVMALIALFSTTSFQNWGLAALSLVAAFLIFTGGWRLLADGVDKK